MKFAINAEQQHFFQKNSYLELEGLLTSTSLQQIREGVQSALSQKLHQPLHKIATVSPIELITSGRDLWRHDEKIKKFITSLAAISSELVLTKTVRLGYDQLLLPVPQSKLLPTPSVQPAFMEKTISLEEMSCLRGLSCGAMLCLKASDQMLEPSPDSIFPIQAGNVTFFTADKEINFTELHRRQDAQFLLIAYTENIALYVMQENDPCLHDLKSRGYVFGDRLNDRLHPIVYR